jgi:hypothetical protein
MSKRKIKPEPVKRNAKRAKKEPCGMKQIMSLLFDLVGADFTKMDPILKAEILSQTEKLGEPVTPDFNWCGKMSMLLKKDYGFIVTQQQLWDHVRPDGKGKENCWTY